MRKLSRRQWIAVLAASLILFALASHTVLPTRTSHVKEFEQVPFEDSRDPLDLPDTPRPVDDTPVVHVNPGSSKYYEAVLNGPPTAKFRGNPRTPSLINDFGTHCVLQIISETIHDISLLGSMQDSVRPRFSRLLPRPHTFAMLSSK